MRISTRHDKPWIAVPPLGRLPDAPQPPALHAEIERRHGMVDLLDVLEEADHLSGFTRRLLSVASREITDADTARRRKLLVSFALGSNIGIKRITDAIEGHPDDTEAAPRRFRRIYFTRENLRAAIVEIVNKTLQVRDELLWGPGTVGTSDSKQLGSWAHQALDELGRVGRTIFLCNLLADENVRREVHEARQVVETWNSGIDFIFYGKDSELTGDDREDQEISMLSMHLLQSSRCS